MTLEITVLKAAYSRMEHRLFKLTYIEESRDFYRGNAHWTYGTRIISMLYV